MIYDNFQSEENDLSERSKLSGIDKIGLREEIFLC